LEEESGDLHVVVTFPDGALVCLIDGLGHGHEAAEASRAAEEVLLEHPGEEVLALIERCHLALRKTRGAVMSLASFRPLESTMWWGGVGNVDCLLLRAPTSTSKGEALALRGGVVGYQLPVLRASSVAVSPGDILVMATDGVSSVFSSAISQEDSAQEIAESVIARFTKGTDDARVVVARYLGAP